jgi:polyhydroxyalkanoate synthesis regulator phasin
MNELRIKVIAIALSLSFSTGALAHSMSKAEYLVRNAKAEANYAEAKELCDDLAGKAKYVCVNNAKTAETAAKADIRSLMETSDMGDSTTQISSEAHNPAQACATSMQAFVAAFRANILQHAN